MALTPLFFRPHPKSKSAARSSQDTTGITRLLKVIFRFNFSYPTVHLLLKPLIIYVQDVSIPLCLCYLQKSMDAGLARIFCVRNFILPSDPYQFVEVNYMKVIQPFCVFTVDGPKCISIQEHFNNCGLVNFDLSS